MSYCGVWSCVDDGATWNMLTDYKFSVTGMNRYENTLIIASHNTICRATLDITNISSFGTFPGNITAIDACRYGSGETIVATEGGIYKTTDGGIAWHRNDNGIIWATTGSVQVVTLPDESERIVGSTSQDGIHYSDNDGENWVSSNLGKRIVPGLLKAAPDNPQRIYAGGDSLFMSDDYGEPWNTIPSIPVPGFYEGGNICQIHFLCIDPLDSDHIGVCYETHGSDFFYGKEYYSGHYADSGEWNLMPYGFFPYSFLFDDTGCHWGVEGSYRSTLKLRKLEYDGNTIESFNLPGDEQFSIWNIVDQTCYVCDTNTGHVLITDDMGATWNASALVLNGYKEGSWNQMEYQQSGSIFPSPDNSTIFLLYPGNGILASTDNGKTWGHFDDGIDTDLVYQIAFSPSDPSVMYAATENGLYRCDSPVVITDNITSVAQDPVPASYLVIANHPNPFNPTTTITYTLPAFSPVTLSVYSITGQKIATLVDEPMAAGTHAVRFDGAGLASSVYLARLEAGGSVETRKMLMVN